MGAKEIVRALRRELDAMTAIQFRYPHESRVHLDLASRRYALRGTAGNHVHLG